MSKHLSWKHVRVSDFNLLFSGSYVVGVDIACFLQKINHIRPWEDGHILKLESK